MNTHIYHPPHSFLEPPITFLDGKIPQGNIWNPGGPLFRKKEFKIRKGVHSRGVTPDTRSDGRNKNLGEGLQLQGSTPLALPEEGQIFFSGVTLEANAPLVWQHKRSLALPHKRSPVLPQNDPKTIIGNGSHGI